MKWEQSFKASKTRNLKPYASWKNLRKMLLNSRLPSKNLKKWLAIPRSLQLKTFIKYWLSTTRGKNSFRRTTSGKLRNLTSSIPEMSRRVRPSKKLGNLFRGSSGSSKMTSSCNNWLRRKRHCSGLWTTALTKGPRMWKNFLRNMIYPLKRRQKSNNCEKNWK